MFVSGTFFQRLSDIEIGICPESFYRVFSVIKDVITYSDKY